MFCTTVNELISCATCIRSLCPGESSKFGKKIYFPSVHGLKSKKKLPLLVAELEELTGIVWRSDVDVTLSLMRKYWIYVHGCCCFIAYVQLAGRGS